MTLTSRIRLRYVHRVLAAITTDAWYFAFKHYLIYTFEGYTRKKDNKKNGDSEIPIS